MVVSKKNKKLRIYVNFKKLNVVWKKDPYPLLLTNEFLNTVARHDAYSSLNEYSKYRQISITLKNIYEITFCNRLGSLYLGSYVVWSEERTSYSLERINKTFKNYLDNFTKIFLDGFIIDNDMDIHLNKLRLWFKSAKKLGLV